MPGSELVYLDAAATTPLSPAAREAMLPWLTEQFGNASSAHRAGRRARQAIEDARELVARLLDASPEEVIFTSGATEANNLAIRAALAAAGPPAHILASPIEHACIIEPLAQLARAGHRVEWLPVGADGVVQLTDLPARLRPDTRLLCLMLVNHETGAIQPVAEAARLAAGVRLHCDAAQAVGKLPVSFRRLGVATLSASAHKFHGPPGVGLLLARADMPLEPLLHGGHQERGRRPGTEPVALIVGLAAALAAAERHREAHTAHVLALRQRFLDVLSARARPLVVNGPATGGLAHVLNVSFPGCVAGVLLMKLDLAGIACSTGSACSSGSLLPSPVLRAMGVGEDRLTSAMRFSFHAGLSLGEVEEAAQRVATAVEQMRALAGP
jgi:cysteine desulfurase